MAVVEMARAEPRAVDALRTSSRRTCAAFRTLEFHGYSRAHVGWQSRGSLRHDGYSRCRLRAHPQIILLRGIGDGRSTESELDQRHACSRFCARAAVDERGAGAAAGSGYSPRALHAGSRRQGSEVRAVQLDAQLGMLKGTDERDMVATLEYQAQRHDSGGRTAVHAHEVSREHQLPDPSASGFSTPARARTDRRTRTSRS